MSFSEERSRRVVSRDDIMFSECRALYKSMGWSDNDLARPVIGIANSWNELVPGHFNLRQVAEFVKKGIYRAGGSAVEFGVIACCDAHASGHDGMKYILPSRELIADDVETMVTAQAVDGLVLLGSCDKIIPGMLMAAVRTNVPSILLNGGPMLGGAVFDGRPSDSTSMTEAAGMLQKGEITLEEFKRLENTSAPGCGACSFYGTANSMACVAEALGMSLPGSAAIPAVYADRYRAAEESGARIVEMVEKGIRARDIVTKNALENAVTAFAATGGSTNCVLHLSAIADELDIGPETMMNIYSEISDKVPTVAKINPASNYNMEDFHRAGGIPQVMLELKNYIHADALTVSGRCWGEEIELFCNPYGVDREVIKSADAPFSRTSGVAILRGNLAPETAVAKPAAIDPSQLYFSGPAHVFDSEEEANEAIFNGRIAEGEVIVIRYEGPRGGPGMREMYHAMKLLYGMGLAKKTALVTDGRFSGTNNGCFVGHISPEAAAGGPIALIEDGDRISIDIANRSLTVDLADEVLAERKRQWTKPQKDIPKGRLALYAKLASSAAEGGVMKI